mmetsp:Transcript_11510/g.16719  ORF Transcript_11510/g.16719 Transcript_11510/m.16719 type:complete len:262 (+) Transcript_11510:1348-2133(+)
MLTSVFRAYVPPIVLFRKCLPGEKDYHRSDIVDHLSAIGLLTKLDGVLNVMTIDDFVFDGDDTVITPDTYFTKLLPKQFVRSRDLALDAIREGLTLNGLINIPVQFSVLPFEVVSKLAFSIPDMSADDVIAVLKPEYSDEQIAKEEQEFFFHNILKQFLKDKAEEEQEENKKKFDVDTSFLSQFVKFCTGLNYLPYRISNPEYSIVIEFNSFQCTPEDLPVAHTCENTMKIHGSVYNNDREKFEGKLMMAIESTDGCFGMN